MKSRRSLFSTVLVAIAAVLALGVAPMAIRPVLAEAQAQTALLGGRVFEDLTNDGVWQFGEPFVSDVTVHLLDGDGVVVESVVTGLPGLYMFTILPQTRYRIQIEAPAGREFAVRDAGADGERDSDVDPVTGQSDVVVLGNDEGLLIDAGFMGVGPPPVGNFVWDDLDGDGIQDAGERGVPDVVIALFDSADVEVFSTVTPQTGKYFAVLPAAGEYRLRATLPDGRSFTMQNAGNDDALDSDVDPETGEVIVQVAASGRSELATDIGVAPLSPTPTPGSISGFTFEEPKFEDGLYVFGGWDELLGGVVVNLRNADDVIVATATTTWRDGYEFAEVPPGTYVVEFELPQARSFSPKDQPFLGPEPDAESDLIDSDADPDTGRTDPITVGAGDVVEAVSAGFGPRRDGAFDGRVWLDANANGLQDSGEVGIAGVGVELFAYLGQIAVGYDETDEFGRYSFDHVQEGAYDLNFWFSDDLEATRFAVGDDRSIDSDLYAQTVEYVFTDGLGLGDTADAGLVPRVLLGDVTCDGLINIVDALAITLYDVTVRPAVTSCVHDEPAGSVAAIQNGDVNGDGEVDIVDAMVIAQCEAALNNVFCPAPE